MKKIWIIVLILIGIVVAWYVIKPDYTYTSPTYDMPEGYDQNRGNQDSRY
jgi:hypothetical protein